MKELKVSDAMKLVRSPSMPAVSIFLGTNVQERDWPIRIRANLQLLYRKVEALLSKTHDKRTRERLLRPLKRALSSLRLTKAKGGVAIYHSEKFTGIVRLPIAVSDLAVAADSFHVKPLLRCAQLRRNFLILAFRKSTAELILVTADGTRVVAKKDVQLTHESLSSLDDSTGRLLRREGFRIRRQRTQQQAMLRLNDQLKSYWLADRLPLLLAGPQHRLDSFRAVCTYSQIRADEIAGYIDDLNLDAIVETASRMMEQYFSDIDRDAVVEFHRAKSNGLASTSLSKIAKGAAVGQVQTLLIAEDRQLWGHLDRTTGQIRLVDEDQATNSDDLLDDIAELTLANGGKVTVMPSHAMPDGEPIAAVLRWNDPPETISPALRPRRTGRAQRHEVDLMA